MTITTDDVWVYRPESHKTEHHSRERRVYLGPKAQAILRPWLNRGADVYCFSPAEAEAARAEERRRDRKSPMTPSQAKRRARMTRKRRPGARYTKDSYRAAIQRACRKAGIPEWSPNQLRHSRATRLRELYGIEASQVVLGHSDPQVTTIYAERDFKLAARIMREVG